MPDHDLVLILLNNPGFGGCGGGGFAVLPLGVTWDTIAHEFGHGMGGFCDEYCQTDTVYSGGEPGCVDNTINKNRATLKWARFVNPATPVPTGVGKCADYNQGAKPGGLGRQPERGFIRRRRNRHPGHLSAGNQLPDEIESAPLLPGLLHAHEDAQRRQDAADVPECAIAGDFDGDGKSDALIHNGNGIMTYRRTAA